MTDRTFHVGFVRFEVHPRHLDLLIRDGDPGEVQVDRKYSEGLRAFVNAWADQVAAEWPPECTCGTKLDGSRAQTAGCPTHDAEARRVATAFSRLRACVAALQTQGFGQMNFGAARALTVEDLTAILDWRQQRERSP